MNRYVQPYIALYDSSNKTFFKGRKPIKITTSGTSTPTDYQVKLTISYESGMEPSFADVRFNTEAGVYIDYWIESHTDSTTADIWIELPDAITDNDTIWMYYNNASLSDGSVAADTFIQYHGAATTDYLDALVVSPSDIAYESKIKVTSAEHNNLVGLGNTADVSDDGIYFQLYDNGDLRRGYSQNENVKTIVSESPDVTINSYVNVKITYDGVTARFYIDDNEISSGSSTNLPDEDLGLFLWNPSGTVVQDWSFVRKYIANEPTISYGPAHVISSGSRFSYEQ